jgi:hypothetical protein
MTFFVRPTGAYPKPRFNEERLLLRDIVSAVPAAGILYEGKPDADYDPIYPSQVIRHADPRLGQVKEGLTALLQGYRPPETPPDTVSRREYQRKGEWEGDFIRQEKMEGILNYAAHTLREVIVFAQQQKQDIRVN